uniref:Uncharacterized protein n=1 Tax=Arion vulgaris TaxID=1028688 RepID=A0A0B7A7T4_9EUPU
MRLPGTTIAGVITSGRSLTAPRPKQVGNLHLSEIVLSIRSIVESGTRSHLKILSNVSSSASQSQQIANKWLLSPCMFLYSQQQSDSFTLDDNPARDDLLLMPPSSDCTKLLLVHKYMSTSSFFLQLCLT